MSTQDRPATRIRALRCLLPLAGLVAACAPLQGYPVNPMDDDLVTQSLQPWLSAACEATYEDLAADKKQAFRDKVVVNRLRAYDLRFAAFEASLWGDGNVVSTGGDLAVLALSGLGATTRHGPTAAALAAAAAGIVGGEAAITKDLYYQRTLPALLAQIEANRDRVKAAILDGLGRSDAQYSLYRADLDLAALQRASGIPAAVGSITGQAVQNQSAAAVELALPHYTASLSPPDDQAAVLKLNAYIGTLVTSASPDDHATLEKIAGALGAQLADTARHTGNNIRVRIDQLANGPGGFGDVKTRLQGLVKQEMLQ